MVIVEGQNLWLKALDGLPSEQRDALTPGVVGTQTFSGEKLLDAVETSQQLAKSKSRTILTPRGPIEIKEKLDGIAVWIRRFIAVGDVAVQYDPGHAALPWAAFRLVLQVFLNDGERASAFASGLEQVAFIIYDCAVRETLYLDGINRGVDDLREHIVSLYQGILGFLAQAWDFFQSGTAKRLLRSIGQNGRDVIALLGPVSTQAGHIITICGRIDAERQLDLRESVNRLAGDNEDSISWLRQRLDDNQDAMQGFLTASHQETLDRLDSIDKGLSTLLERSHVRPKQMRPQFKHAIIAVSAANAFQGKYGNYNRSKILEWLSNIPYVQHHMQTHGDMLTGTGKWFFERETFQNWLNSDNTAMLWFHGAAGQGKTKVMSLVIEQALIKAQNLPYPLFFYCSRAPAEPERARAEDILRCLVKQIALRHEDEESRFPRYIVKEYKDAERTGFAINQLSASKCCEIIAKYVKDQCQMIICIDAVDECSPAERYDLFDALQSIVSLVPTSNLKILISSRDDGDIESFLPGNRTFEIRINDDLNRKDIAAYVETEVTRLIKQRRISIKGKPPTAELQSLITQKLRDGAQGMFRWVSLQLEYICTLKTTADIKQRLGRLPRELTKSYDELYDRKLDLYDKEDKDRLEYALTLMLWIQQPLDLMFARMIFFDIQDDDDPSLDDDGDAPNKPLAETEITHDYVPHDEVHPLIRETIRLCFNFLVHDPTASIYRFAHTSVQDYLQTHRREFTDKDRNLTLLAEKAFHLLLRADLPLCHEFVPEPSAGSGDLIQTQSDGNTTVPLEPIQGMGVNVETSHPIYLKGPSLDKTSYNTTARLVFFLEGQWATIMDEIGPKAQDTSPIRELLQELIESGSKAPWAEVRPFVFLIACEYGNLPLVTAWLDAHPALLNILETSPLRRAPLLSAAYRDNEEIIETLISKGASVNSCNLGGCSILAIATVRGLHKTMRYLIDRGADIEGRKEGPITTLVTVGNEEVVENFFPQVDIADNYGFTPLCLAIICKEVESARLLIESGANVNAISQVGSTLCIAQTLKDDVVGEQMTRLLLDSGVNVNAADMHNFSPLIFAASSKYLGRMRMLLDAGADTEIPVFNGETALLAACENPYLDCVEMLLTAGANPNAFSVAGGGALALAAGAGNTDILKLLLPLMHDVNNQDWDGDTALFEAMKGNHSEAVKILFAAGAEIVPSAPGPHCPFLPEEERLVHFGRDVILRADEYKKPEMCRLVIELANQREMGGEYAEVAALLGEDDRDALNKWIQDRREKSPRSGPLFEEFEKKMHKRVEEIEYGNFEKLVAAAGRKILYYKYPIFKD